MVGPTAIFRFGSVSIHIRRLSRMRHERRRGVADRPHCFNPHPAVKPDETPGPFPAKYLSSCFNPHPAVKPDETPAPSASWLRLPCFNPHPAVKPDETSRHSEVCIES